MQSQVSFWEGGRGRFDREEKVGDAMMTKARFEDVKLLALKNEEEAMDQEMPAATKSCKRQGNILSPRDSRGSTALW